MTIATQVGRESELRLPALRAFARRAQAAAGCGGEVAVRLLGAAAMRRLNRAFRGADHATDVLSFPGSPAGGDLAVCVPVARRQARAQRHALDTELRVLLLHGLLHLAGHDHERDGGEMAAREAALRRRFRLPGGLIERGAAPARKGRRRPR